MHTHGRTALAVDGHDLPGRGNQHHTPQVTRLPDGRLSIASCRRSGQRGGTGLTAMSAAHCRSRQDYSDAMERSGLVWDEKTLTCSSGPTDTVRAPEDAQGHQQRKTSPTCWLPALSAVA
jgi:hypothetical protein